MSLMVVDLIVFGHLQKLERGEVRKKATVKRVVSMRPKPRQSSRLILSMKSVNLGVGASPMARFDGANNKGCLC